MGAPLARDTPLYEALLARADHATRAIDWCEQNYAVTPLAAEFWNTLTSILFCLCGYSLAVQARALPRLRAPLALCGPIIFALGACSAAYHATLSLAWQRADEVAENVALAALLHGAATAAPPLALPLAHGAAAALGVLRVHALLFTELHLVGAAVLLGARLRAQAGAAAARAAAAAAAGAPAARARAARAARAAAARAAVAAAAAALGAAAWLADRAACSALTAAPWNPQLHAWWHAAGAVALHEAWAAAAAAGHALDGGGYGGGGAAVAGKGDVGIRVVAGGLLSVVESV
jgi:alkaline ceramidase